MKYHLKVSGNILYIYDGNILYIYDGVNKAHFWAAVSQVCL